MNSESMSSPSQNPSFSLDDFAKALEAQDFQFSEGKVISGTVIEHSQDGAFIDIKGKSPGFLPLKEISFSAEANLAEVLPLDTERDFLIIKEQDSEGQVTLSIRRLEQQKAWEKVSEMAENEESVQILVTGTNKGGVIGEVEGLRGFVPRSHLIQRNNLESLVGQILTANFLQVDQQQNKLVLSQRQMAKEAAMSDLQKGQLVTGTISKIQPYGVFVDLNGISGLLHIKQISNQHVDSLFNLFQVGETVKVMIAELDEVKKRISLSTKVLEDYPGEILEKKAQLMNEAENRLEKARRKLLDL